MAAKAPEEEYGGYDYEFVEKVPDKYNCNICTKVQRDPHLTACCGQHYCQSCLEYWFKKHGKKSCPHCREEKDFNHVLNKAQKREIGELKIHCTFHKDGCQWVGELDSLQTHLNSDRGCGYVEVSCTNKCGVKGKRKNLKRHLANSCPLRKYKCQHCSRVDTYQAISQHYDTCSNYPLPCPNKCGKSNIKRKNMSAHRETCRLEEVNCTNKCGLKIERKDLKQHLTKECPLRKCKCEYCGHEDTHQAITGVGLSRSCHYNICPKFPLDCPNRCGTRAILRRDMSDHQAECPLEPVECPFKEAGCEARLVRKDYDAHMTSNTQQHLLQAFQTQQRTTKTLQDEFKKRDSIAEESHKKFQILKAGVSYYMGPLMETCAEKQKVPFKCIQSLLDDPNQLCLEIGHSLTITMPEFSHYKQSGKVWHSPPFYYREGYKMCLVVYANGTGAGAGTHVSVSLLLLRGELDDRLMWGLGGWGDKIRIQLVAQREEAGRQRGPSVKISLCYRCSDTANLQCVPDGEDSRVVGSEEKFANHPTVQQYNLLHDSTVLRVSLEEHEHEYEFVQCHHVDSGEV